MTFALHRDPVPISLGGLGLGLRKWTRLLNGLDMVEAFHLVRRTKLFMREFAFWNSVLSVWTEVADYWNGLTAICMAHEGPAEVCLWTHVHRHALVKAVQRQIRLRTWSTIVEAMLSQRYSDDERLRFAQENL